jgi:hypothetical protein
MTEIRCVKCGSTEISTTFHGSTDCFREYCDDCHEHGCHGGKGEHLVRYCRGCSYVWYDLPIDHPQSEAS